MAKMTVAQTYAAVEALRSLVESQTERIQVLEQRLDNAAKFAATQSQRLAALENVKVTAPTTTEVNGKPRILKGTSRPDFPINCKVHGEVCTTLGKHHELSQAS
jgi:hypothetical protein